MPGTECEMHAKYVIRSGICHPFSPLVVCRDVQHRGPEMHLVSIPLPASEV